MSHYSIEIKGHSTISWKLLRRQRDLLVELANPDDAEDNIEEEAREAVRGVYHLLDAMLDTHDQEEAQKAKDLLHPCSCPNCGSQDIRYSEWTWGTRDLIELGEKGEDGRWWVQFQGYWAANWDCQKEAMLYCDSCDTEWEPDWSKLDIDWA